MMADAADRARVQRAALAVSAAAWGLWLLRPAGHVHGAGLARDWALMVAAMMTPLTIAPLQRLRAQSLARRRGRATVLFAAGYGAVWMAAGAALQGLAGAEWPGLAVMAAAAAVVWQCSPWKQACLNGCHRERPVAAFGAAAYRDALRMGVEHGAWCAGSCWALMLAPLTLPGGHTAAMAMAGALMICERLEEPRARRWEWRGMARVSRMAAARLRGLDRPVQNIRIEL